MTHLQRHPPARHAHGTRTSPRDHARAGHTLLEILLALGLSLVILTAVYAALDQHWRYAEAGQRQTERLQVTRALFERLSLDLRAAVFQPGSPRGEHSMGIQGDAETLVVQIAGPAIDHVVGPRTVRWELRELDARQPSDRQHGRRRAAIGSADKRVAVGLTRADAVAASPRTATALPAAVLPAVAPDDVLAAEVETIRFRYFGGGRWFDQWDSAGRQALPRAVEITIGFRRVTTATTTTNHRQQAGEYRLVVPIPAAEA